MLTLLPGLTPVRCCRPAALQACHTRLAAHLEGQMPAQGSKMDMETDPCPAHDPHTRSRAYVRGQGSSSAQGRTGTPLAYKTPLASSSGRATHLRGEAQLAALLPWEGV